MDYRLPTDVAGARQSVLVADDDPASRKLLQVLLEREGATVHEAPDGRTALSLVEQVTPHLLLLDVNMPRPDGIELTRLVREKHAEPELPIILVTAQTDLSSRVAGLEAGATDFISKPFEAPELIARVRAVLRMRSAFERLESAQSVLASLANAVDAKDPSTEHHCSRLAETSLVLAQRAGIAGEIYEAIGYGAVLHDVGKIGVPEAIIRKAGPLDDDEWAEMRRHPVIGAGIVEPLRLGRLVAPIVRGHHEHWNGRGYPDGLAGEEIPVGARIVTIVDAYDAMTNDRPYRKALSPERARSELARQAGRQFDPELAQLFLEHLDDGASRHPARATAIPVYTFTRGLIEEPVGR